MSAQKQTALRFESGGGKKQVVIFADEREVCEVPLLLASMDAIVKKQVLPVGDYILSERVAVERKTRTDFENSIMDGRLFHQARELTENFERALLVVEGERFEERVRKSSLLGALASLMVDYGISVFFTRDAEKTAELLYAIARREQLVEKKEIRLLGEKKAKTLAQRQQLVVETLPNVGPKLAKALLKEFGSVQGIFNADERQLEQVEKIGEKKARGIRKVITSQYEEASQSGNEEAAAD